MKKTAYLLFLTLPIAAWAQNSLTFNIVNNRSEDVYLYFANASITGTDPDSSAITTNIANTDNNHYLIGANSSLNGFTIESFIAGRIFFSIGEALDSGNGSNFNNPTSDDFSRRMDHFEITYDTGIPSSGANMTGTDFFGVPLELSSGSSSVSWTPLNFSSVFSQVIDVMSSTSTNQPGDAIVTGPQGVAVDGVGNVVRLIAPSTATAGPTSPYRDIGNYHDSLKDQANTIHVLSDDFGNNYNLQGGVQSNGDVLLNQVDSEGTIQSILISADYFTAEQIYGANPAQATINGTLTNSADFTPNEAAAIRDIYAGFNLGVWGSTEEVNGKPLGEFTSKEFFDLASVEFFFSNAQPDNPDFYNAYAEIIAQLSNNSVYGFPYSDVLGGQFINLDPSGNPVLTLTIQPDVIPEPETYALIMGVLVLGLLVLRRRLR